MIIIGASSYKSPYFSIKLQNAMNQKYVKYFVLATMVLLYATVSIISTIHSVDFFRLSNPEWLAITLAIAFEIGATASLASLIILDKSSKLLIWSLFIVVTGMQINANLYYAYVHLEDYQGWIELFGLNEEDSIFQKRVLSIISGAILPLVALGFVKSLVDYMKPEKTTVDKTINTLEQTQHDNTIKSVTKPSVFTIPSVWISEDKEQPEGVLTVSESDEPKQDESEDTADSIVDDNEVEMSDSEYKEYINDLMRKDKDAFLTESLDAPLDAPIGILTELDAPIAINTTKYLHPHIMPGVNK